MNEEEPKIPPLTPLDSLEKEEKRGEAPSTYSDNISYALQTALFINNLRRTLALKRLGYGNSVLQHFERSSRTIKKIRAQEKIPTVTELLAPSEAMQPPFRKREGERRGVIGRIIQRIKQAL